MKRKLIAILLAAFLLAACGARSAAVPEVEYAMPADEAAPSMPMEKSMAPQPGKAGDADARERIVIKNAELSVVVKDPEVTLTAIAKMTDAMGGFIVSSNLYQSYGASGKPVPEANVVVRVPSEKLDEALEKIKSDAVEVQSETQSGQDVTSEYVDLESQLKNLEAAEKQLVEIMQKAEKTEDVLEVFNQLTSIRNEIEVTKGRMKYFEESAAFSAITVRLVAEETIEPIEVLGWKPEGTLRDAVQNLVYFFQNFVDFMIWFIVNFLPKLLTIVMVFGLPIYLIVRAVRKAARKRKAAQLPQQEK